MLTGCEKKKKQRGGGQPEQSELMALHSNRRVELNGFFFQDELIVGETLFYRAFSFLTTRRDLYGCVCTWHVLRMHVAGRCLHHTPTNMLVFCSCVAECEPCWTCCALFVVLVPRTIRTGGYDFLLWFSVACRGHNRWPAAEPNGGDSGALQHGHDEKQRIFVGADCCGSSWCHGDSR